MTTIIAASASAPQPLPGQEHRSGYNFQLLGNNGQSITISSTSGVVFDIKQDVSGTDPTPVKSATNGTIIPGGTLEPGKNYYIANPNHATANFLVTLNQN